MQFDPAGHPPRFSLFAVLDGEADEDSVRKWLAGISLEVPSDLGVVDQVEAASSRRISLELIESSYSADITQLTWRPNNPKPEGAV